MKSLIFITYIILSLGAFAQFNTEIIIDSNIISPSDIKTADINNDGFRDIVINERMYPHRKLLYYINNGNGSFGNKNILLDSLYDTRHIELSDLDGNGWVDIITHEKDTLFWLPNNGGNFGTPRFFQQSNLPGVDFLRLISDNAFQVADMDNDGDIDVFVMALWYSTLGFGHNKSTKNQMIIYTNDGTGNFTPHFNGQQLAENHSATLADITGNGYKDVIISSDGGSQIFTNQNGVLSYDLLRTSYLSNHHMLNSASSQEHIIDDIDMDGDFDLISNSRLYGALVYMNDGNGIFNFSVDTFVENIYHSGEFITSIDLNDLDNDGDKDLIYMLDGQKSNILCFENNGMGSFNNKSLVSQNNLYSNAAHSYAHFIISEDFNNDGKNDLLYVLRNTMALESSKIFIHFNGGLTTNNDILEASQLKLYPNPMKSIAHIEIPLDLEEPSLSVYDLIGNILIKEDNIKGNRYKLNKGHIKQGLYFVELSSFNKTYKSRLIVK